MLLHLKLTKTIGKYLNKWFNHFSILPMQIIRSSLVTITIKISRDTLIIQPYKDIWSCIVKLFYYYLKLYVREFR